MPPIVPFDPKRHSRDAFRSGAIQVDNFFKRTANKLAGANNVRLFVMEGAENAVIGFYALNAHAVDYAQLDPRFARTRPGHGNIPAAFIAMMGIDERCHGQGLGGDLLADCLLKIVNASESLGIAVAVLDILDCGDTVLVEKRRRLYQRFGFIPMAAQPMRMYLALDSIKALVRQDTA